MTLLHLLLLLASLGSLLMAGVFFAFSTAVMPAFRRVPPAAGMQLMQSINKVILNPLFLGVFCGTALLAIAAAVLGWRLAPREAALWMTAGAFAYVLGVFGVTAGRNVPMNEALDRLDADSSAGQDHWAAYLRDWTFWNTVRTGAGSVSGACLVAATLLSK